MKRMSLLPVFLAVFVSGCGPSAKELREQTISTLNTQADGWKGGQEFDTSASDAYGRPVIASVKKTTLSYVLEIRSHGPDGLPKNSDDIVVSRSKRHGETSLSQEAEKGVEDVGRGAASGVIQGLKKELGLGKGEKRD